MASNPLFIKPNFFLHFPNKLCLAEFFWKMQRKTWYSILGASFPQKPVVNTSSFIFSRKFLMNTTKQIVRQRSEFVFIEAVFE